MIDAKAFIGQVHEVTVDTGADRRTVTIEIADAGPLPYWDNRPMIQLTVRFADGRRSHVSTADAAAGQLAGQLFAPYSVGMLNPGDGFEMQVGREYRKDGPKNGRTSYRFTVFVGSDPTEMQRKLAATKRRLAAVAAELGMTV